MSKPSNPRRLKIKGEARVNIPALFLSSSAEKLGMTKSVYSRFKNSLEKGDPLPKSAIDKIMKKARKGELEFVEKARKPIKIEISKTDLEFFKRDKKHNYLWTKIKFYDNGKINYVSFILPKNKLGRLTKETESYIKYNIRKYGKFDNPVIMGVTTQLIGKS